MSIMIEKLEILLKHLVNFNEIQLKEITKCFKPKILNKNTILLSEGEICKEFYFVHKGCIRTYFLTKNGQEKTRLVMPDCSIGTALTSFISQKPSFEFIETTEDTELLFINHLEFYDLVKRNTQWNEFYLNILEMAYSFQNNKIAELVTLSAKQRYEKLIKENPILIQKLSNKILATYLDIREETLSRLKSK